MTIRDLGFSEIPFNECGAVGGNSKNELLVHHNASDRTAVEKEPGDRLHLVEGGLLLSYELREGVAGWFRCSR